MEPRCRPARSGPTKRRARGRSNPGFHRSRTGRSPRRPACWPTRSRVGVRQRSASRAAIAARCAPAELPATAIDDGSAPKPVAWSRIQDDRALHVDESARGSAPRGEPVVGADAHPALAGEPVDERPSLPALPAGAVAAAVEIHQARTGRQRPTAAGTGRAGSTGRPARRTGSPGVRRPAGAPPAVRTPAASIGRRRSHAVRRPGRCSRPDRASAAHSGNRPRRDRLGAQRPPGHDRAGRSSTSAANRPHRSTPTGPLSVRLRDCQRRSRPAPRPRPPTGVRWTACPVASTAARASSYAGRKPASAAVTTAATITATRYPITSVLPRDRLCPGQETM